MGGENPSPAARGSARVHLSQRRSTSRHSSCSPERRGGCHRAPPAGAISLPARGGRGAPGTQPWGQPGRLVADPNALRSRATSCLCPRSRRTRASRAIKPILDPVVARSNAARTVPPRSGSPFEAARRRWAQHRNVAGVCRTVWSRQPLEACARASRELGKHSLAPFSGCLSTVDWNWCPAVACSNQISAP
jgi:hypothetical protein